ncbi:MULTISPECIES: hypothetical protein [Methylosinus]|uniref:Uncharacterized protein n=1 Tax=Methylosinus sporium TaxID=428 RepID=A0A2U1SMH5_METSR|nr:MULTISPECIES: hypothetical protein [Methylosinus]PWB92810.1 hypothetical protein C5689_16380 [Methylosinus sporium]
MKKPLAQNWPKPDLETLDREIGSRMHRLSAGRASAQDASEASKLIRDRADFMMPGIFQRLSTGGQKKKAG